MIVPADWGGMLMAEVLQGKGIVGGIAIGEVYWIVNDFE